MKIAAINQTYPTLRAQELYRGMEMQALLAAGVWVPFCTGIHTGEPVSIPSFTPGPAFCHRFQHRLWAHLFLCFHAKPEPEDDGVTAGKNSRAGSKAQSWSEMAQTLLNVEKVFQLDRRILKSAFHIFWWNRKITHNDSNKDESQAHFPLSYFASSMSQFLLLLWHLSPW